MSELQHEWTARRWTPEEIEALMECEVNPDISERLRAFRHGGEQSDLSRFAEETGRSYKAVKSRYWHEKRKRQRQAAAGAKH